MPDLYFGLNVFPIQSPALRGRSMDIPLLATHFIEVIGARLSWGGKGRQEMNGPDRALRMPG
ncbi:hypothetical protein GCM10027398_19140 [Azotobacter salinestris]